MKTNLKRKISSSEDAKQFLKELFENGESYHPEDSATDVNFHFEVTEDERIALDELMSAVYHHAENVFDPCEYLQDLQIDTWQTFKAIADSINENDALPNPDLYPYVSFSETGEVQNTGMKLRDHFAGLALQGLVAGIYSHDSGYWKAEMFAEEAYLIADAMLKQRIK